MISPASAGSLDEAWTLSPGSLGVAPGPIGAPIVAEGDGGVHATVGVCSVIGADRSTGELDWVQTLSGYSGETLPCEGFVQAAQTPSATGGAVVAGRVHLTPSCGSEWLSRTFAAGTGELLGEDDAGLLHGLRGDDAAFYRNEVLASACAPPYMVVAERVATVGSLADATDRRELVLDLFWGTGAAVDAELTLGDGMVFQAGAGLLATVPGDTTRGMGVRGYSTTEAHPGCGPLVVGSFQTDVECPTWATAIDGTVPTEPVIGSTGDVIYVGTDAGTLYALDAADGTVLWTATVGAAIEAPAALAYGTLYVPTSDGRLIALAESGCGTPICTPLWESSPGSGGAIRVQPAAANGVVFAAGAGPDGELRAFATAGCGNPVCTPIWSTTTGSAITGAPAIRNGFVYLGTSDGRLIAYKPT